MGENKKKHILNTNHLDYVKSVKLCFEDNL